MSEQPPVTRNPLPVTQSINIRRLDLGGEPVSESAIPRRKRTVTKATVDVAADAGEGIDPGILDYMANSALMQRLESILSDDEYERYFQLLHQPPAAVTLDGKELFEASTTCTNCGFIGRMYFNVGVSVSSSPCSVCGYLYGLKKLNIPGFLDELRLEAIQQHGSIDNAIQRLRNEREFISNDDITNLINGSKKRYRRTQNPE